jgi:hypothetical protein
MAAARFFVGLSICALGMAHPAPQTSYDAAAEIEVVDVRGIYDEPAPRRLGEGRRLKEELMFSREQAEKTAGPSKQLLLTFTNRIRVDFAATWVGHIRRLGLSNFLVGATDDVRAPSGRRERQLHRRPDRPRDAPRPRPLEVVASAHAYNVGVTVSERLALMRIHDAPCF